MEYLSGQIDVVEPNGLIAFGLLLLCGVLGGMLANRVAWMPTITAFMLFGFVFGPNGLNLFSKPILEESTPLIEIALGLILYKLGNMLHPLQIIRSKRLLLSSAAESGATYILIVGVLIFSGYEFFIASMIGAIAISSSPAVLVHVSEELGASGPITDRAKSMVALNNLISFIIFTLSCPFAFSSSEMTFLGALLLPLHMLVTSAVFGIGSAWIAVQIAKLLRPHDEHYRFALIVGSVIFTIGLSKMLHTSILFSTLSLGIATRWFERRHSRLSHIGLSEGGDLFFIVLFVLAGAKIDLNALALTGFLPLILFMARTAGKFTGIRMVRKLVRFERVQARVLSLLMLPMAGMAIGLATTAQDFLPETGGSVSALVFSMVALFETIGPFAAVKAFRLSGEIPKDEQTKS